jgi:DNA-binding transcriptional ArsR family regulator
VVAAAAKRSAKKIEEAVRYALGHRTRVKALMHLNEGIYTAAELAGMIGVTQSNLSNHLRRMLEEGSIEIAKEEFRGNMMQFWYRAVEIPVYTQEDAEAMTPLQRKVTVGAIFQAGSAETLAALEAGTLADPKSIVFWHWYNMDDKGKEDLENESDKYLERVREIEVESANRLANGDETGVSMLVNLAVFERARKVADHS